MHRIPKDGRKSGQAERRRSSVGAAADDSAAGKPPIRDFSRSLPMALLRAREAVMRQFRPSLRDAGLTEQQWRILRALASVVQIEVTELAHETYLLGPSLSRILRDLEARRLIRRRSPQSDLRRGLVSITPAGTALLNAVGPVSEAIYAEITRRVGAKKLATLQGLLKELEQHLHGHSVDDSARDDCT